MSEVLRLELCEYKIKKTTTKNQKPVCLHSRKPTIFVCWSSYIYVGFIQNAVTQNSLDQYFLESNHGITYIDPHRTKFM